MNVVTVRANGAGVWVAGLVGQRSRRYRSGTLTSDDLSQLTIADATLSYQSDGRLLRISLQACSLGIAWEFDPYFGLSISHVDPLPQPFGGLCSPRCGQIGASSLWWRQQHCG